MWRIKGKIEEEWILLVSLDEVDGIIGRNICIVLDVLIVLICLDVDELVIVETVVWIIVGELDSTVLISQPWNSSKPR